MERSLPVKPRGEGSETVGLGTCLEQLMAVPELQQVDLAFPAMVATSPAATLLYGNLTQGLVCTEHE